MAEGYIPILPVMKPILYSDLIPVTTLTNGENYMDGCSYMKIGCFVLLYISIKFSSPPSYVNAFTLPTGYRPVRTTNISAQGGESFTAVANCVVTSNGSVLVSSVDKYISGFGLFVAGAV